MKASNLLNYKDMPSPVGTIRLVASDKGLVAVLWEGEDYCRTKLPGAVHSEHAPILLAAERQLEEYFARTRTGFDLPLDLRGTEFQIRAWEALLQIPYGKTRTYGELARILGDIKAVRAVGGALNKNPVAIIVPCHRVIGASGKLVGFAGGLDRKSLLLSLEQELRMPSLF
ncbi:methylated-DNA--[protein]-cysteine S-methyltransferase [Edaphocola flava]|uniref:methylated-DNA--[protein]-cysteine S-methyltransferase n=1 Tax=Edaphocola flava TaxID=2499629 RepID=UPI00100B1059|nr:methylated-DNA--[protein]-cysteine S-methyltransferase [Edaphocola flava]